MDEGRLRTIGIVAAALLVGGTVVAVLLLGGVDLPDHPDLGETAVGEGLTGQVAVVVHQEETDQQCVDVVDLATGEQRRLTCPGVWAVIGWDGPERVVVEVEGRQQLWLDPTTGAVLETVAAAEPVRPLPGADRRVVTDDGSAISVRGARGRSEVEVVTADGERRTILESPSPRTYGYLDAWWAPDDRHALVLDDASRLLLVDTTRPGTAAEVADDVVDAAWQPAAG